MLTYEMDGNYRAQFFGRQNAAAANPPFHHHHHHNFNNANGNWPLNYNGYNGYQPHNHHHHHHQQFPAVDQDWSHQQYPLAPPPPTLTQNYEWSPIHHHQQLTSPPPPPQTTILHQQLTPQLSEYSAGDDNDSDDVSPSPVSHRTASPSYGTQAPPRGKSPFDWIKKNGIQAQYPIGGAVGGGNNRTRTKDKYRVVYTDQQRLELEKEFHFAKYITIRRKTELASFLGLSERQVKIWFQNRRAKERKQAKKRLESQCKTEIMQQVGLHHGLDHITIL